jgi:hypothetical protein
VTMVSGRNHGSRLIYLIFLAFWYRESSHRKRSLYAV